MRRASEQRLPDKLEGEVRLKCQFRRALYSTDASVYQILPLGVVIPKSREDVIRTVQTCREFGVSITAGAGNFAGGTGDWRGSAT